MTHTLNRTGLNADDSKNEFIFLCMIPAAWKGTKADEMTRICDILLQHKPDNLIGTTAGLDPEGLRKMAATSSILTAVFNDPETIERVVEEIKAQNLGISIVLSGRFDRIHALCQSTGTCEHTRNISLGVFGKTERLPEEGVLSITTQCGHALIASRYVEHVVKAIQKGKMTVEEGVARLVKPCVCGIANPQRIHQALENMAQDHQSGDSQVRE